MLQGLMQDWPLTVDRILDHAKVAHGAREVVTRSVEGPIVRTSYAEIHARAKQVSAALFASGIGPGDRVATLGWNTARHIEAWYGTMGIGAVLHTLNPRLFPEQIVWIANHAEDKLLFVDLTFLPLIEKIADKIATLQTIIVFCDRAHLPAMNLPNVQPYEEWLAAHDGQRIQWGNFPESTASGLCYTSGTTGDPKGVLYSHRSNVLHTLLTLQTDCMGISQRDTVMPVVPMFHANAWGVAFSAPAVGARLILPGARMDGPAIHELLETEQVTFTAAVPTVWLMLMQHLEATNGKLTSLKRVVIGGAAVPEKTLRYFEDNYGVEVIHAWGMTELSPLGTLGALDAHALGLAREEQVKVKLKQGRAPFGVEMKVVDDAGKEQPRDGASHGRLLVRGPAIAKRYFKAAQSATDEASWFDTGDVAHIDPHGYMQITDRAKDVIKSGGEWISSMDVENIALGYPDAANAAVIGRPHPKWDERPLLIMELKPGAAADAEQVRAFLEGKIAKWWMPDDIAFVEKIPLGATGKINKLALREQFKDHVLSTIG